MGSIRTVTETLIRKIKADIRPGAVLVLPDDLFEVQRTPSVILQGPNLSENKQRRSLSRLIEKDIENLSFEDCAFPRLYHLDFDLVVTVGREAELLDFHEAVSRFLQCTPVLPIDDKGSLNLTELAPLGGLTASVAEMRSKLGLREPKEGEAVLMQSSFAEPVRTALNRALNRTSASLEEADELDALYEDELSDWEPVMSPLLEPVKAIIEQAETFEEALAMFEQSQKNMDSSVLCQELVKAFFLARAHGDEG